MKSKTGIWEIKDYNGRKIYWFISSSYFPEEMVKVDIKAGKNIKVYGIDETNLELNEYAKEIYEDNSSNLAIYEELYQGGYLYHIRGELNYQDVSCDDISDTDVNELLEAEYDRRYQVSEEDREDLNRWYYSTR